MSIKLIQSKQPYTAFIVAALSVESQKSNYEALISAFVNDKDGDEVVVVIAADTEDAAATAAAHFGQCDDSCLSSCHPDDVILVVLPFAGFKRFKANRSWRVVIDEAKT